MTREEAQAMIDALIQLRDSITDEQALDAVALYPKWKADKAYILDERVQYNDILYRCVQPHTSLENWTPDATPALWTKVSLEQYPEWVQPTGAHDAYNVGDTVSYNGAHYICKSNTNVYAPGVYGWEIIPA